MANDSKKDNPNSDNPNSDPTELSLTGKKNIQKSNAEPSVPPTSGLSRTDELFVPPSGPPRVDPPSREIYAAMGEENIFRMLEDFYLELEKSSLREMFPPNMIAASKKSAAFFVGLLGGPPLYHQKYGSPMMRARHLPFAINEQARLVWLTCFDIVLEDAEPRYSFPAEHIAGFRHFLDEFSKWMVNRRG